MTWIIERWGTTAAAGVFRAEEITRTYGSGRAAVHALRGVTLEIPEGDIVVVLSPSSSGKSTFLNIIGGLDRATASRVFFRDIELTGLNDKKLTSCRRRHAGFVFQFYKLTPSLTAEENVERVTEIADNPMAPADGALVKQRAISELRGRLMRLRSQGRGEAGG